MDSWEQCDEDGYFVAVGDEGGNLTAVGDKADCGLSDWTWYECTREYIQYDSCDSNCGAWFSATGEDDDSFWSTCDEMDSWEQCDENGNLVTVCD